MVIRPQLLNRAFLLRRAKRNLKLLIIRLFDMLGELLKQGEILAVDPGLGQLLL